MANDQAAWGIDIGQAGLKAIRLQYAEAADQVTAVAFDYIPHPKILSQPDANPDLLIRQALETFLSRNKLDGDTVTISVPGQSALARFIQLPPVESSKVAEIVKYEARQQIPFALEDVIWDYQTLGSGTEEGGFMLDAEVGLFAMKRDQVQQSLDPFLEQVVEVESIQIAPLALHNFVCFDRMELGRDTPIDPDAEHTIVLDMGADNTTLLITNGHKIWLRNVPMGGNHFTRALTKELKLTFAKAEHLKLNATKSPDPRSVFQALRPVFNDFVAEIQRSIGYFSSVNKDAKIARIVGVGNGFKLAGLQKFLQQNLQYEVDRVHSFDGLLGDSVLRAPMFQDNIMSFAVPYGLALQGLEVSRLSTSLLPPEIITERLVRQKKPWAIAAAAALLLALSTSMLGYNMVLGSVSESRWSNPDMEYGNAEEKAKAVKKVASDFKSAYSAATAENQTLKTAGDTLVGTYEDRIYWPEVYKAINECLPRPIDSQTAGNATKIEDPSKIERVSIEEIYVSHLDDTGEWFKVLTGTEKDFMLEDDKKTPPSGPGYLFTLGCVHHYNEPYEENPTFHTRLWIRDKFLANFKKWTMQHADSPSPVPVRQVGITHATMIDFDIMQPILLPVEDPEADVLAVPGRGAGLNRARGGRGGRRGRGRNSDNDDEYEDNSGAGGRGRRGPMLPSAVGPNGQRVPEGMKLLTIPQTDFVIQFVWTPTPYKDRLPEDPRTSQAAEGGTAAPAGDAPQADTPAESAGEATPTGTEPAATTP